VPDGVNPPAAVGFIGLGRMGIPMSSRLRAAGYQVRGYDVSEDARRAFDDAAAGDGRAGGAVGGGAVGCLAEAADGARAVVLMLPDSAVIRRVAFDDGLLEAMAPGSLLVDMSSSQPSGTVELAAAAASREVVVVGAPVSGGVAGAAGGTLTIMAGGPGPDVARARPLLEAIGGTVLHVGDGPGAGHALKSLNNLLAATTLLATSEAMLAGQRYGLDPETMLAAINISSGRSAASQSKWPDYVLAGRDTGFAMRLMVKDMAIALGVARDARSAAPLAETTLTLWERAARSLPPDADQTAIVDWLRSSHDP
jgi:3-hydroxyisobutyrate dehydrogenase